jgi:hypothetical protein
VCWEGVSLCRKGRREPGWTEKRDGDENEMEDLWWSGDQVRGMRRGGRGKISRWKERVEMNWVGHSD